MNGNWSRLAALGIFVLAITPMANATPIVAVDPEFTYTFIACDFEAGCPHPTTIVSFQTPLLPVIAPSIPAGTGMFYSAPKRINVSATLAGGFSGAYIESYRNVFGQTGSFFMFDHLSAANGNNYGTVVGVDAFVAGPSTNPLSWDAGNYGGLIAFNCNYGLACPSTSGANESVRVNVGYSVTEIPFDIDSIVAGFITNPFPGADAPPPPEGTIPVITSAVPEPGSMALLASALGTLVLPRRRRRRPPASAPG
jgi:hypothetical protein